MITNLLCTDKVLLLRIVVKVETISLEGCQEKVKARFQLNVYLSQTMWNHAKKSLKKLKRLTSVCPIQKELFATQRAPVIATNEKHNTSNEMN